MPGSYRPILAGALLLGGACRERVTAPVVPPAPVALAITPTSAETGVGDSVLISATLLGKGGDVMPGVVSYAVNDTSRADIDIHGMLKAKSLGTVTVTARADGFRSDAQVDIVTEERRAGSADWRNGISAAQSQLAVWASPYSAISPDTLDVFVQSTQGAVTVSLYRLGWYSGSGGRMVWKQSNVSAGSQPDCTPPFPGPVECPWSRTTRIPVSPGWPSGVYMVHVESERGDRAMYPLVIRGRSAATFTIVVPQFTWQAYNEYGGSGLYTTDPSTGKNVSAVSFERPFGGNDGATYMYGRGGSNDISALRWIERMGYDVNYVSDLDLAIPDRTFPSPTRGLIFIGHSEYWTWAEYDRVEQFRDGGKHLAFFSGNNAYWNVRLFDGTVTGRAGHIIWCAKRGADPRATTTHEITGRFRDSPLNRPENALYGVMWGGRAAVPTADYYAMTVADSGVGSEAGGFLRAAGLSSGDQVPAVMGTEGDMIAANGRTPPNLQVLFRSTAPASDKQPAPVVNHATFFIAPSGAGVFASGSNEFAAGLDGLFGVESTKLQALTKAILDWMAGHGG